LGILQAEGSAPFKQGAMVDNPETIATAIRIGHPQSWDLAHEVEKESNGWFDALSEADILSAQKLLTQQEGIFCPILQQSQMPLFFDLADETD
jgi:threonine synthase